MNILQWWDNILNSVAQSTYDMMRNLSKEATYLSSEEAGVLIAKTKYPHLRSELKSIFMELEPISTALQQDIRKGKLKLHLGKIYRPELEAWMKSKGIESKPHEAKPTNIPNYLNNDLEEHSHKLAAAVKAWEHFYIHGLTYPKKSLKENIEAWLTEHAKELNLLYNNKVSKQAIEEIAKIVNWKTEGGAPKS